MQWINRRVIIQNERFVKRKQKTQTHITETLLWPNMLKSHDVWNVFVFKKVKWRRKVYFKRGDITNMGSKYVDQK